MTTQAARRIVEHLYRPSGIPEWVKRDEFVNDMTERVAERLRWKENNKA